MPVGITAPWHQAQLMVHQQQRSSCCLLAETPILVHAVSPVAVPVPRWSTPPLPFGTAGGCAAAGRALLSLLSLPHMAAWLQEDEGERAASRQPARPADPWGGSELCAGKRGDQSPGGSPRCPAAVCRVSPGCVTPGPFLSMPGGWHGEQGVSFLPRALPTWLCPHIPSVKGLGTGGAPTWGAGLGAGGPGGAPASAILGWRGAARAVWGSTQHLWVGCGRPPHSQPGQDRTRSLSPGAQPAPELWVQGQDPRKPGPEPRLVPMGPPVSRWCCRPGSEVL